MCYMVERQLNELGSAVNEQNKAKAKLLVDELRKKIEEKASTATLKSSMDELRGALVLLQQDAAAAQANAQASAQGGFGQGRSSSGSGAHQNNDDDIVDVEVSAA
jgi:hypothetical protein